jgi:hypothetical protein
MASPLRRTLQQTVHDGAIKSIMFVKKVQLKKNEIRLSTSINYFYTLKKPGTAIQLKCATQRMLN